ncbi:MAG TPA: S8 family serine peptidase, partial [Nocardioidaceae bacterium]|nr:S8 family serine peptidase [Nocardioidaceae bacterium]
MSRWMRTAAAAALLAGPVTVLGGSPASADEPPSCEVGKTQYVSESSYAISSLGIPQSWGLATGKGVTVAVVDSGVDPGNAHLRGAVLPGTSFVPGPPTQDLLGHGTGVAGIIAARYVNGSALIGAAPAAKILPVRVFQDEDTTGSRPVAFPPDTRRMAEGIAWAVRHGADVVNVSMSTRPTDDALPALKDALALARRRDVVVVASGGNQTEDAAFTQVRYPAGGAGVIGVAATGATGVVDNWSIHGSQNDVSAPGANVLIAYHANGDCLAGQDHAYTSWATGFVSGLAAQLRQRYPKESADQIAYRIMASADRPRMSERDDEQGWGQIRPYTALTMSLDPNRPGPPLPGAAPQGGPKPAASPVTPLAARPDPLAPARAHALWWGLAAGRWHRIARQAGQREE